jgi:hypothetical protein
LRLGLCRVIIGGAWKRWGGHVSLVQVRVGCITVCKMSIRGKLSTRWMGVPIVEPGSSWCISRVERNRVGVKLSKIVGS